MLQIRLHQQDYFMYIYHRLVIDLVGLHNFSFHQDSHFQVQLQLDNIILIHIKVISFQRSILYFE